VELVLKIKKSPTLRKQDKGAYQINFLNISGGKTDMAKARKLPSGSWRVQANKSINGILTRKSFTAEDKKTAEFAAMSWQADVESKQTTENITLLKAYEKYIESKENVLSPSTIRAYKAMSRSGFQSIMQKRIDTITHIDIQYAVNEMSITSSPKYIRNEYGLFSAVIKMFHPGFSFQIRMPQKEKTEMYIPDDNDISKLLKFVKGKEIEIPILLAAFGPMRRGEICALTSENINGNIITVKNSLVYKDGEWVEKPPKTFSSYRDIEYPEFVIERLKGIKGRLTNMTPSAITNAFSDVLKNAGIPHFRFHDLRHYAVSTLHAMNVPDKYIMQRGGWTTNYTMNNVYNHTLKKNRDEQTQKILTHFNKVSGNNKEPSQK